MSSTVRSPSDPQVQQQRLRLFGLTAGLVATGAGLYRLGGPPHLPHVLPGWTEVLVTLRGPELPMAGLAYVFFTVAWLLWLWMVGSIALHTLVVVAEGLTSGTWVRRLRSVSDRLTVPLVRRLVEGAFVALFLAQVAGRAGTAAAAQPLPPVAAVVAPLTTQAGDTHAFTGEQPAPTPVQYTVQSGDTLWAIAQRFYGAGEEFPRLVEANAHRKMPDGRRFTGAGVIYPGWLLTIPEPSTALDEVNGQVFYTVEAGDTLAGIAVRLLGDPNRWPEIFDLNRGSAKLADGRTLQNASLIWPGLRLKLPLPVATATPPPPPADLPVAVPYIEPPALPTTSASSDTPLAEPTVVATPVAAASPPRSDWGQLIQFPTWARAGGAVAGLAAGASALALRTRRLRSQRPTAPADVVIEQGFAEAQPARVFSHNLEGDGPEPVSVIAQEVLRFLHEHGVQDVPVLWVRDGRKATTIALAARGTDQGRLIELGTEFGRLLGGAAEARLTHDQDVEWRLNGIRWLGMAAESAVEMAPLLPLVVLPNQDILYVNWDQLGNTLVASLPNAGSDVIITSLLASLAARLRPDELRVMTIARNHALPRELAGLPHQLRALVDGGDPAAVGEALAQLHAEVSRRLRFVSPPGSEGEHMPTEPDWLVVIADAADVKGHETTLDFIASKGRECGVRLVLGLAPPVLDQSLVELFPTRLVLHMPTEGDSVRLLGQIDAADLGGGGHLLVRLGGRSALTGRGFKVAPEDLSELVEAIQLAYGQPRDELLPVPTEEPGASAPPDAAPVEIASADDLAAEPADAEPAIPDGVTTVSPPLAEGPLAAATASEQLSLLEPGAVAEAADEPAPVDAPAPLIEIRCFGSLQVSSGGRKLTSVRDVNGPNKGWEMLAFLATHDEDGVSKDKLLMCLWPELDSDSASNRMRVTMTRLRTHLANQVAQLRDDTVDVVRAHDGRCRLGAGVAVSDAHRFLTLCAAITPAPLESAQTLYDELHAIGHDDLLDEPSYAWVDDRDEHGVTLRERFRKHYEEATRTLAMRWRQEKRPDMAVPLLRNLLALDPTQEDVVADLYHCYLELGDVGALIREERHFREALQNLFGEETGKPGSQPGPAIAAVFNQVRRELELQLAHRDDVLAPDERRVSGG